MKNAVCRLFIDSWVFGLHKLPHFRTIGTT